MRITQKLLRALFAVGLLFGAVGCSVSSSSGKHLLGTHAPYTKFQLLDGSFLTIEELRGKTTVVVFWATWCAKSRRVLNKLNAFAGRYAGRSDVVFLTASIDKADKLEEVRDRVTYTQLNNFRHAFSGNDIYDEAYISFDGDNLPFIIVIDPAGKIVHIGTEDDPVYAAFGVDPETVPDVNRP